MNYANLTEEERKVFKCLQARQSGININEANEYMLNISVIIYINFSFYRKNLRASKYSAIYFSK